MPIFKFLGFFSLAAAVSAASADLMQQEIEHVVVVMLENRSFDNVLAWLYADEQPDHFIPSYFPFPFQGLNSKLAASYANPLKNTSGELVYSCAAVKGVPSTAGTEWLNSPKYDPFEPYPHVIQQIYGSEKGKNPKMKGFVQDYASLWNEDEWEKEQLNICSVMETYTAKELPVLYGLARHYAVSDLWFSSVPTQTNPNRAFSICGTSEGQTVNGFLGTNKFHADTIWNRLQQESPNTSWKIFWQTDVLPGIFPGPYHSPRMFTALESIPDLDSHYMKIDRFHEMARNGDLPDFSLIEPQWTLCEGFEESKASEILAGFQGNDLHPPGDIRTGENFLANIYTSLIANQKAWEKTLLVVLFDEHGGLFDHVPPPAAVPPDDLAFTLPDNLAQEKFAFDRYGVRTPALFISPKIKKGTVIRSHLSIYPFDHTSLIATLLKWKQVPADQWNFGKRVAIAPTFETVITEKVPRMDPTVGNRSPFIPEKSRLSMGGGVFLKDPNGKYLTVGFRCFAAVSGTQDRVPLRFGPAGGKIYHGSFVRVEIDQPCDPEECVLDSASVIGDCAFKNNAHVPSQWWTVKSVDHPYLGYEIQDGDRVYLESHIYLDPFLFVPSRLAVCEDCFFNFSVVTKPITDKKADNSFWVIEKK